MPDGRVGGGFDQHPPLAKDQQSLCRIESDFQPGAGIEHDPRAIGQKHFARRFLAGMQQGAVGVGGQMTVAKPAGPAD